VAIPQALPYLIANGKKAGFDVMPGVVKLMRT
jgi:hypothetical protein